MLEKLGKYIHNNKTLLNIAGAISTSLLILLSNNLEANHINNTYNKKYNNKKEIKFENQDIYNLSPTDIPYFDTKVINTKKELDFLSNRANDIAFTEIKIINRSEFNQLKGNIFIKQRDNIDSKVPKYSLFLTEDITILELPSIIKRINKITYGEEMPITSSTQEIKIEIESIIKSLLEMERTEEVKKSIKNYYKLYQQYFPGDNPQVDSTKSGNTESNKDYLDNINKDLSKKIYNHFFESFFEHGSKVMSDLFVDSNALLKEGKNVLNDTNLDDNKLSQKQKKVLDHIFDNIKNNFNLNIIKYNTKAYNTTIHLNILQTKQITCVGLSILGHEILESLGLDYSISYTDGHSFIVVKLANGDNYIFDPLKYDNLIAYNSLGNDGTRQNISYSINGKRETEKIIVSKDADKTLIGQILATKEFITSNNQQKVSILKIATNISEDNPDIWYNLAYYSNKIGNYGKAYTSINKAILLSPKDPLLWLLRADICGQLGDSDAYIYSKSMYEKLIKQ